MVIKTKRNLFITVIAYRGTLAISAAIILMSVTEYTEWQWPLTGCNTLGAWQNLQRAFHTAYPPRAAKLVIKSKYQLLSGLAELQLLVGS
jgi:hypothetical protein